MKNIAIKESAMYIHPQTLPMSASVPDKFASRVSVAIFLNVEYGNTGCRSFQGVQK